MSALLANPRRPSSAVQEAPHPARRPVAIGLFGALAIVLGSAMRGWPFPSLTAEPWIYQLSTHSSALRYAFLVTFLAGCAGVCWAWARLVQLARHDQLSVRAAIATFVLWSAPIWFAVPLFSGDVFVYYVDGQAMARGFSLYDHGISAMGPVPWTHMVHPIWRGTTTMYGPVFMAITEAVARAVPHSVVGGVMAFRALSFLSLLVMAGALARLARLLHRSAAEAVAFGILNPITLLHLFGGAHNDATMLALLCAGLAIGVGASAAPVRLLAVALCTAGAAFKVPAFAGVLVLGWLWAGAGSGAWRRIATSAGAAVAGGAVFELLTLAVGSSWGWLNATDVPGLAHPVFSPPNALAFAVGGAFGIEYHVNTATRVVATACSLALGTWLVMRTGRGASMASIVRAAGWALLGLAWLSPAVYPWYLAWGVVVVGTAGALRMRRLLVGIVVVSTFIEAPGGYGWLDNFDDWRRTVLALVATGAMAVGVRRACSINDVHPVLACRRLWSARPRPGMALRRIAASAGQAA